MFQSTRPVWGATPDFWDLVMFTLGFNPRAPCGARRKLGNMVFGTTPVSIHAPRVGRDVSRTISNYEVVGFQSTRPVWGATVSKDTIYDNVLFQSTRPVWGATSSTAMASERRRSFNPRAPCGARRRSEQSS